MFNYNNQNTNGFTLIELMIAISILSMLLFTGSYTYSLMSQRWNKELGTFSTSAKIAKNLTILQRLIEGVQPYVVIDNKKSPSFFFIGDETSLLAVSRAGIFSGDYPEIFRLTTIENSNGLVDLVYQSASTENVLLIGTDQEINFTKKLVLFNNLEKVEFRYYGWNNLSEKSNSSENGKHKNWLPNYSGINKQLTPELINLKLTKSNSDIQISIFLDSNPEHFLSPYMGEGE